MSHVLHSSVIVLTFCTAQGALTSDVFGWHPWWRWADWWGPLAEWDLRACPPQSSCGPSAWSWPGMGRCSPAMLGTLKHSQTLLATMQFIHLLDGQPIQSSELSTVISTLTRWADFFCGILSVKTTTYLKVNMDIFPETTTQLVKKICKIFSQISFKFLRGRSLKQELNI